MATERFVRWQRYSIAQLTFALNLFLGLSGASLAFGISLLREEGFCPPRFSRWTFSVGLVALTASVLGGCAAVVSRVLDFRFTARTVRADENEDPEDEAAVYRYRSKVLGRLTWRLFWFELCSFLVGAIGIMSGLFARYGHKLW